MKKIFGCACLIFLLMFFVAPAMAADAVTQPPLTAHQEYVLANYISKLETERDKAIAERDAYAKAYESEKNENEVLARLYKEAEEKWNKVVQNAENEIELLKKENGVLQKQNGLLQKQNTLLKKQIKMHQSINVILGTAAVVLAIL